MNNPATASVAASETRTADRLFMGLSRGVMSMLLPGDPHVALWSSTPSTRSEQDALTITAPREPVNAPVRPPASASPAVGRRYEPAGAPTSATHDAAPGQYGAMTATR